MINRAAAIAQSLRLEPVPTLPDIRLYTAHPGSRLSQFADPEDDDPPAPYWAYQWAGGLALAHHFRAHPELVQGKRILDLGAGSGLVGIIAARLGAHAKAAEIDPNGRAAIALNASANGVTLPLIDIDLSAPPQNIDLIAAGDVFYNAEIARLMLPFLTRCAASGITVLIGDPDRRDLPLAQLELLASYAVGDVGDQRTSTDRTGSVYRLK